MFTLEQKVDIILQYITTDDKVEKNRLKREATRVLKEKSPAAVTADRTTEIAPTTLEDIIFDLLREIGVPCHLVGYDHLICAIKLCVENSNNLDHMTKGLYPAVAKLVGSTATRVERGMRHAIEVVWDDRDLDNAIAIFGNTISVSKSKPTNGEFIAMCTREVQRRMRKMK